MNPEARNHTIWCKAAVEAISVLKDYAGVLVRVSLEHDLEESSQNSSDSNCGMAVVRYLESLFIADLEKLREVKFISHSWNIEAGREMSRRIEKLGFNSVHRPFGL